MFLDSGKIQFSTFQDADLFVKLGENRRPPGGVLSIFSYSVRVSPRNTSEIEVLLTRMRKIAAGAEINLYL